MPLRCPASASEPAPYLRREKLVQHLVEARRALHHRNVPGVLEDDLAGARDQALVLVRVLDRDDFVVAPPDDQSWAGDLRYAVLEVVVEDRPERVQESGLASPACHLVAELGRDPLRVARDLPEQRAAQPRAPDDL